MHDVLQLRMQQRAADPFGAHCVALNVILQLESVAKQNGSVISLHDTRLYYSTINNNT